MERRTLIRAALAAFLVSASGIALAQDAFKIGLILPMTGPSASTGRQIEAAVKLYMAQNGNTVAGKKVEVILKDDAGRARHDPRIAQELVVNDKVDRAGRLRPHAAGAGHRADRHPVARRRWW